MPTTSGPKSVYDGPPAQIECRSVKRPGFDGGSTCMTDAAWDVRPLQPGSRPGDRGSHIIEPTWTPGRFSGISISA